MLSLHDFWRNKRGSSFESFALALSVIAIMFVAGADILNHASQKDGFLARALAHNPEGRVAQAQHETTAERDTIDYSPTGSIIGLRRPIVLQPCTGETK